MSDDDTQSIIVDGVPVTAAEYMRSQVEPTESKQMNYIPAGRQHVEPRGLKPEHVPRVQKAIGRKQVTHVVGMYGKSGRAAYHAVRMTRLFDSTGTLVGHELCRTALCHADCPIVLEMTSFDGCCDGIPDARQCEKCLARLNGEVA